MSKIVAEDRVKSLKEQHIENLKKGLVPTKAVLNQRLGEGPIALDKEKLERAVEVEKEVKVVKKRKLFGETMTEEELEAYRLTRHRADDPMAGYVDKESK